MSRDSYQEKKLNLSKEKQTEAVPKPSEEKDTKTKTKKFLEKIKQERIKRRRIRNSLNREEILDAAEKVLRKDGIAGVSMRSISAELNCSVASPYAHFKNQEEIVTGLVQRGENELLKVLKQAVASTENYYEKLARLGKEYLLFARRNQELHKLMFRVGNVKKDGRIFQIVPASYRVLLITLKKGSEAHEFALKKDEYVALARMMWSWVYGIIVQEINIAFQISSEEKNQPIVDGMLFFRKLLKSKSTEEDRAARKILKKYVNEK